MRFALLCFNFVMFLRPAFADWQKQLYGIDITVKDNGVIMVSNDRNTITVRFRQIIETDRNGYPVGVDTPLEHFFKYFETTRFLPQPLEYFDIVGIDKNISAVRNDFVAILTGPGTKMTLTLSVFDNNTMIPAANVTEYYTVFNGTVKFAFTLEDWPFCDANNYICRNKNGQLEYGEYLDVYVNIEGGRDAAVPTHDRSRSESGSKPSTWDYGGGQVTFSHKYYSNNTWHEMGAGYPIIRKGQNENEAVFRFRRFDSGEVFYDPVIIINAQTYVNSAVSCRYVTRVMSIWLVGLSVYVTLS